MTDKIKDGGAAFPLNPETHFTYKGEALEYACGMSLRDYFAAAALTGLLANESACKCGQYGNERPYGGHYAKASARQEIASDAYAMADAMLFAREKQS